VLDDRLCFTGDDVSMDDQPEIKRVYDLDSIQLMNKNQIMRDQDAFLDRRKLAPPDSCWRRQPTPSPSLMTGENFRLSGRDPANHLHPTACRVTTGRDDGYAFFHFSAKIWRSSEWHWD
jgi:hypothetical protein